jgi:hypothetical protein
LSLVFAGKADDTLAMRGAIMLQNRVDPFGGLHAVPQRGAWFGNKGCLHDQNGRVRRGHAGRRWITCVTAFRGRRRHPLMQPGCYTELFFHDEATAYAAGHRPCAECRYADWRGFADLWARVHGETGAAAIDTHLQATRLEGRNRRLHPLAADQVPEGAMVADAAGAVLRARGGWWRWSFGGYAPAPALTGRVALLTPWPVAQLMAHGLPVQIAHLPGCGDSN